MTFVEKVFPQIISIYLDESNCNQKLAEYVLIKAIGTCHYKPLLVSLNENRCFTLMYIFLVTAYSDHLKVILAQIKDPKFFDILLLALDTDQKDVVTHIFL